MSKLKPSNPYAFPCEKDEPGKGMTLRDYFAAKALQAVMTGEGYRMYNTPEDLARLSYVMADAMLKRRQE